MAEHDGWLEEPWGAGAESDWQAPFSSSDADPAKEELGPDEVAWRERVITRVIRASDRLACLNLLQEADRLDARAAELRKFDHGLDRYNAGRLGCRAQWLRQGVERLVAFYKHASDNGESGFGRDGGEGWT